MSGWLRCIGLGPGDPAWITPETTAILADATDLLGYLPYLQRLQPRDGQTLHASDNRVELDRAEHALTLAAAGRRVALVSGGDPGIFAMAAALFEAIERGPVAWRRLDIEVQPGVSAMQAAAARLGAPLGHDFCVISLSDNLKPWTVIERRLAAAAGGDFVIALYNPASRARPDRIVQAFALLQAKLGPGTPVALAKAVGRPDEEITITSLAAVDPAAVDMRTLVLVGSSRSRLLPREGGRRPWLYTPRSYGAEP